MEAQHKLKAGTAKVEAQIVVRDKHGNVKYQGPLVMDVVHVEEKENEDGSYSPDSRSHGDR